MSKIKAYMEETIDNLAVETGYSEEFLNDMWCECIDDDTPWDDFVAITLEKDW